MFANTMRVEIQFGDCDPAGIVYYPNYFRFCDNATAALISAALGMSKRDWLDTYGSAGIPMVESGGRFVKPSSFGDILEIRSGITALGRSSFEVRHTLAWGVETAVEVTEKRVWIVRKPDGSIASAPLPDAVRAALEQKKGLIMGDTNPAVAIRQSGRIAHLEFNRPDKRNALNDASIAALDAFFSEVPAGTRAIVLSGAGGNFSSGLDLSEQVTRQPLEVMAHSRNWHRVMAKIASSPIPVVAALHGAVMGGGLECAAACHVRVAEQTTRFQMPEGLRGIFVGGGGSVRLSRLIGSDRLTEMMLTGRVLDGAAGERLGLAHYVEPEGQAIGKAFELAERIAANSPTINALVIQGLAQIGAMPPEAGLYAESLAAALSLTGPDAEEGLKAFLEKRLPDFG